MPTSWVVRQARAIGCMVIAAIVSGCAVPPAGPPPPPDGTFVAGYHPYWAGQSWTDYPFDVLDRLYFFETEARPDGSLELRGWPHEWSELTTAATDAGVGVKPTISMHDEDGFEELFSDASRTARLVESIAEMVRLGPEIDGVHLDFEVFRPVRDEARDGFTSFVVRLASTLRSADPTFSISVFTLAFDHDDVFNERALAEVADYLVVQGYDFHSMGSPSAGPTAPEEGWSGVNWSTVVRRFDEFGVPRRKVVMSVPLFGYEWPVSSEEAGAETRGVGTTIPYTAPADVLPELPRALDRGSTHGTERDPTSGSVWYRFEYADGWRQGWYDDVESLAAKYDFVREAGLGGIALFPLAYGNAAVWEGLRAAFPQR